MSNRNRSLKREGISGITDAWVLELVRYPVHNPSHDISALGAGELAAYSHLPPPLTDPRQNHPRAAGFPQNAGDTGAAPGRPQPIQFQFPACQG